MLVSGTCSAHADTIEFSSYDSSLPPLTQNLDVVAGNFSGSLTVGSKSYNTQSYFTMRCKETEGQYGTTKTSFELDQYFIKNDRAAIFSTPTITYDNTSALRKTEDCTVSCLISNTYGPLYKYSCEINGVPATDVAVQDDSTYAEIKTWDHNLAYEKWWDTTDDPNAIVKVYNSHNGKESEQLFTIEMEIDAEFDFDMIYGDGYPGSQYCLGDSNSFLCKGDVGVGSNVTKVRFASQSNSDSAHTDASDDTNVVTTWSKLHNCRSSGLGGNFTPADAYAYLEVYVDG